MKDLFRASQAQVTQGMDLVQLRLGSNKIRMYYQTVFEICSKMRGHGTFALRHERNHPALWRELDEYGRTPCTVPLHPKHRRSGLVTNLNNWKVWHEGQLVVVQFDDLITKFHYADAARIQAWMRRAGKQAKNWSGDSGRHMTIFARLTDAEDNDKFAYG